MNFKFCESISDFYVHHHSLYGNGEAHPRHELWNLPANIYSN